MTRLAREIAVHVVADRGPEELPRRLLRGIEHELGVYSQGGKGATSRKTPAEIRERCERLAIDSGSLVYASRIAAEVDSAAVQDGYQLYHHAFFFSAAGHWCVVQQGMSDQTRTARRYQWLSESVTSFVNEPHQAIWCDRTAPTLNLVAAEHDILRSTSVELATDSPDRVTNVLRGAGGVLTVFLHY